MPEEKNAQVNVEYIFFRLKRENAKQLADLYKLCSENPHLRDRYFEQVIVKKFYDELREIVYKERKT